MLSSSDPKPPFETVSLRAELVKFLDLPLPQLEVGKRTKRVIGNCKCGVYAFFDYDLEPIYVGQTNERVGTRIRRHLTNQRTDAVAMKVLDPFEVYKIRVWPLPEYQKISTTDVAKCHLNWLELAVYNALIADSRFKAILNEKTPYCDSAEEFTIPDPFEGVIVTNEVFELRNHPDTRIARRAETLALLGKVISERQVKSGLRRTLLTQAQRLTWLSQRRYNEMIGQPDESDDEDDSEE